MQATEIPTCLLRAPLGGVTGRSASPPSGTGPGRLQALCKLHREPRPTPFRVLLAQLPGPHRRRIRRDTATPPATARDPFLSRQSQWLRIPCVCVCVSAQLCPSYCQDGGRGRAQTTSSSPRLGAGESLGQKPCNSPSTPHPGISGKLSPFYLKFTWLWVLYLSSLQYKNVLNYLPIKYLIFFFLKSLLHCTFMEAESQNLLAHPRD